jgi:hypothetical protein
MRQFYIMGQREKLREYKVEREKGGSEARKTYTNKKGDWL